MSLMLPPSQLTKTDCEPSAGVRLEDFLRAGGLSFVRAAVVQGPCRVLRCIAGGRRACEFAKFAGQVRLIGVAVRRRNLAQGRGVCCSQARCGSVEASYAVVVLGRKTDRCAEQGDEVPRAVTRSACEARNRGRRCPRGGMRRQSVCDGGVHQEWPVNAGAKIRLENAKELLGAHRTPQPLPQIRRARAPDGIEPDVTVCKLIEGDAEHGAGGARTE